MRRSLAFKIVAGLALNLAAVAGLLIIGVLLQVRLKPEWVLAGRPGERLQATAELIIEEVQRRPATEWNEILARYSGIYGMDFLLFDALGRHRAGSIEVLPAEVQERLPRGGRGLGRGLGNDTSLATEGNERESAAGAGSRRGPPGWVRRGPFPRSVVRAGSPAAFWVILHVPPAGGRGPLALVTRTESLWGGGLLADLGPWMAAGALALGVSTLLWLPFARRLTRDLGRVTRQTETIAGGRFDDRLDLRRQDELGRLAEAINRMAERLAQQVAGQKRFLGDAAHELCSPLARLQAAVAILEDTPHAATPERLADLRADLEEMAALVEELLAFSRAGHGRVPRLEAVALRPLVQRAWEREGRAGVTLDLDLPEELRIRTDETLLLRAVANLLRNAVRYAGEAGPITVRHRVERDSLSLMLADRGPGVPEASLPRLFEPFYRPEASRSRDLGGTGLGLAIVKTCVEAVGGSVQARNLSPQGFEVTLVLPSLETPGVPKA